MTNQIITLILDEGKWLTVSLGFALLSVTALLYWQRHSAIPTRGKILASMNLLFGITIGTMAFGHLLAVTTKLVVNTLESPVLAFYGIGAALVIPSWWLIYHTWQVLVADKFHGRATLILNAWLAVTLLALGAHNLPLAAPGLLNIGYYLHSGRVVGWAIVGLAVVVNVGLFMASLVFLASGQSFEQFRGIQ